MTAARIAAELERSASARGRRWAAPPARRLAETRRLRVPWRVREALRRFADRGPGQIAIHGADRDGARQAVLATNELSATGAPKLVHEIATAMLAAGWGVTVLSPYDGPFRGALVEAGAVVVVAAEVRRPGSPLLAALAARVEADALVCNTVATDAIVRALAGRLPTLWYIHEVSLLRERLAVEPGLGEALGLPTLLWAGSELPAAILRERRGDVAVVPYGLDPLGEAPRAGGAGERPLTVGLFGSYEPRKGQDLAVAAMALLPEATRRQIRLVMYGRPLEADFAAEVAAAAAPLGSVLVGGELDGAGYREAMLACDAVLVASRDDTLPLVSLDALGAARVLMVTPTTGTSAALAPGVSGFVAAAPTAEGIAAMLAGAVARRADWPAIGEAGRGVFAARFSKTAFDRALHGALAILAEDQRA